MREGEWDKREKKKREREEWHEREKKEKMR